MELPFDHLKHAMAPGQVVSGIGCNLWSEFATEVVMGAGLDFAIIDTEHVPSICSCWCASATEPRVENQVQSIHLLSLHWGG